ncbi:MAG: hypothetical protein ABR936_05370 [Bacteroidota bacterium]|jgi:hypothetical protein
MGASSLLDIIGSILIGGFLLVIAFTLNLSAQEYSSAYYSSYLLQSNLLTVVAMIEDDFKHIGYCKNPGLLSTGSSIVDAESTKISYQTDYYNTGAIDTVTYWAGTTAEFAAANPDATTPNMFYLYKKIDSQTPAKWNLGLTQFKLAYWNDMDTPDSMHFSTVATEHGIAANDLGSIKVTDISIKLESPVKGHQQYMMDTSEYQLYWRELRMTSRAFKYPR